MPPPACPPPLSLPLVPHADPWAAVRAAVGDGLHSTPAPSLATPVLLGRDVGPGVAASALALAMESLIERGTVDPAYLLVETYRLGAPSVSFTTSTHSLLSVADSPALWLAHIPPPPPACARARVVTSVSLAGTRFLFFSCSCVVPLAVAPVLPTL
jgi:hypothetical protein